MKTFVKYIVFIYTFGVIQSITESYNTQPQILQDVSAAAEWDTLLLVCDVWTSGCPAEDVLSVRPVVYVSMDFTNHSLIVQMIEMYAAPTQLNWLVFYGKNEYNKKINTFQMFY